GVQAWVESCCFTSRTRTRPGPDSSRTLFPNRCLEVTEMNSTIRSVVALLALTFVLPVLSQASGTVPKGTAITVVTDQGVSSKDAKLGQTLTGTVAKDVVVGGKVLIPKGSAAKLAVSSVQASGRLSTPAKLYLRLKAITVKGETLAFDTGSSG